MGDGTIIEGVANPYYSYKVPGHYNIVGIASNDECSNSDTFGIDISNVTNISNIKKDSISIYSYGKIVHIRLDIDEPGKLEIYDLLGKEVYHSDIHSVETNFYMSESKGQYIVLIKLWKEFL